MTELQYKSFADVSILCDFECGNDEMDRFLKSSFLESIDNHYCRSFIVTSDKTGDEILAVFALCFDSLSLDSDDKEELITGISSTSQPAVTYEYEDTFLAKRRYPALEITYLAVSKKHQGKDIGRTIVDNIADIAMTQKIAGCQFLTVEALKNGDNPAVPFYYKCNFAPNELPDPNKDTLRMYRTLYTKS